MEPRPGAAAKARSGGRRRAGRRRVDLGALAVLPAGMGVILLAQLLEGGAARSLVQGPAALIVFGGTLAALLISYPPAQLAATFRAALDTFRVQEDDTTALIAQLVGLSLRAHRKGLLFLDGEVDDIDDPFLRNGLQLVIDGTALDQLKDVVNAQRALFERDEEAHPRVFEAAAGYAPTLGILGAVLGLIQVMEHLSQPGALGSGIAVAFVATIYGVGSANLVFLPLAARLRERATLADRRRDLIVEGLCAIQQRVNPRLVAQRLHGGALAEGDRVATPSRVTA